RIPVVLHRQRVGRCGARRACPRTHGPLAPPAVLRLPGLVHAPEAEGRLAAKLDRFVRREHVGHLPLEVLTSIDHLRTIRRRAKRGVRPRASSHLPPCDACAGRAPAGRGSRLDRRASRAGVFFVEGKERRRGQGRGQGQGQRQGRGERERQRQRQRQGQGQGQRQRQGRGQGTEDRGQSQSQRTESERERERDR